MFNRHRESMISVEGRTSTVHRCCQWGQQTKSMLTSRIFLPSDLMPQLFVMASSKL